MISWEKLPWMPTLLSDPSPDIRIRKASQMAVSTYCILWLLWLCRTQQAPRGIAYWLPSDGDVRDFVRTKVDKFVEWNVDRLPEVRTNADAYNVGLKFFWGTPTYWRGIKSKSAVKSISADATVFDEFDECDPSQVAQARERMSASEAKLVRELSTPTIPDYGIDKRFEETDQCFLHFKCRSCGHWQNLEETFQKSPGDRGCIMLNAGGEYYRGCMRCSSPLDLSRFEWVMKHPGRAARGYQISQLYSPWINLADLMRDFATTDFIGHFWNHKIGLPYLSGKDRVTAEQVLSLCDSSAEMKMSSTEPTAMGIDVGTFLHVVILKPGDKGRILWIGTLRDFEDIDQLAKKFNVRNLVIDAMPETRKVHELTGRMNRRAWACWYSDHLRDRPVWNEEKRSVTVNRTDTLDVGTDVIHREQLILPRRTKDVEEFALHCANIVKVAEKNPENGDLRYAYKRLGPDHFRHALNYAQIAAATMRAGVAASAWRR